MVSLRLTSNEKQNWYRTINQYLGKLGKRCMGWKSMSNTLQELCKKKFQGGKDRDKAIQAYKYLIENKIDMTAKLPELPIEVEPEPKSNKSKTRLLQDGRIKMFYQSYQWRMLRFETLLKYGRKCMCCGATTKIHVDHIKPLRKYWHLRLDPENMQVLCEECNHGKGNWNETDFRPKPAKIIRIRLVD